MSAVLSTEGAEPLLPVALVAVVAEPQEPRAKALNVLQSQDGRGDLVPAQGDVLHGLMKLRDEYSRIVSNGKFQDSAAREWRKLPRNWREDLLTLAGLGSDMDSLLQMAGRDWHEIPPPERGRISGVVRSAKQHLTGLVALAAKG